MNRKLIAAAIFILGATTGVALSSVYYKKKYEDMMAEEIESINEFGRIHRERIEKVEAENASLKTKVRGWQEERVVNMRDYTSKAREYGEPSPPEDPAEVPYPINFEDFNGNESYEKACLTYYEPDDQLVDEDEELIPDIETYVCLDFARYFDDPDSDDPNTIYIRNEKLRMDFEITRMHVSYAEMMGVE